MKFKELLVAKRGELPENIEGVVKDVILQEGTMVDLDDLIVELD